jgi:hypothetical protein
MVGIGPLANDIFVVEWWQRSQPRYFMTGSDNTKEVHRSSSRRLGLNDFFHDKRTVEKSFVLRVQ